MHNNYYFLRKLSAELKESLQGFVLMECYSQNKDELVLSFLGDNNQEIYIIANLGADFSCLYFPKEYHRARKNSISLFNDLKGLRVKDVVQIPNERLFYIDFTDGFRLAFKLFGNRANILLFRENQIISIFKNSLKQDKSFVLQEAGRKIDFSLDNFLKNEFDLKKTIPTLGDIPQYFLQSKGYNDKSDEEKFQLVKEMLNYLNDPEFFVTKIDHKVVLSLFNIGVVLSKHKIAIDAINNFYNAHYRYNYLEQLKLKVIAVIDAKLKSGLAYIEKNRQKIKELEERFPPEKIADIIMANLHSIAPGVEKVTLFDFYRNGNIEIQLKKDISPQKNAEILYRKSKKRPLEVGKLNEQVNIKDKELEILKSDKAKIESIEFHKDIDPFVIKYILTPQKEAEEPLMRFKEYEFMGYKIYVGRNADNNDELTQKFARKDDLWLHAKDVAGSHVVIKFQSGQNFPKPVIERAASLAAYYSKRKNESLCPVAYTQKKYVRKVKGTPAGEVKVERETVIMVEPREF